MTRNDLLTFDGLTQPLTEWALDYGITPEVIMMRLRAGMSVARAITTPMRMKPGEKLPEPNREIRRLDFDGRSLTVRQWSDVIGLPATILHSRISDGWDIERALTEPYRPRRGVSADFAPSKGTGAGSFAQETPQIDFPTSEVSP